MGCGFWRPKICQRIQWFTRLSRPSAIRNACPNIWAYEQARPSCSIRVSVEWRYLEQDWYRVSFSRQAVPPHLARRCKIHAARKAWSLATECCESARSWGAETFPSRRRSWVSLSRCLYVRRRLLLCDKLAPYCTSASMSISQPHRCHPRR